MAQILWLILVVAIAIFIIAFLIGRYGFKNSWSLEKARQAKRENKEEAKNKILKLFKTQNKIRNRDVESLLSVSDATATNYLEELQKEGKIAQNGGIGRGVFYTQING